MDSQSSGSHLIDSGSTHNFIDLDVVHKLSLGEIIPLNMKVQVANGDTLSCSSKCPSVTIQVQGTSFGIPLYRCTIHARYKAMYSTKWNKNTTSYSNL